MSYITKNELIAQAENLLKKAGVSEAKVRNNTLYYSVNKMLKYQSMEEIEKTIKLLEKRAEAKEYRTISGAFNHSKLGVKISNFANDIMKKNLNDFLKQIENNYKEAISYIKGLICSDIQVDLSPEKITITHNDLQFSIYYKKKYNFESKKYEYSLAWKVESGFDRCGDFSLSCIGNLGLTFRVLQNNVLKNKLEGVFVKNLKDEKFFNSLQNELEEIKKNPYENKDDYKKVCENKQFMI